MLEQEAVGGGQDGPGAGRVGFRRDGRLAEPDGQGGLAVGQRRLGPVQDGVGPGRLGQLGQGASGAVGVELGRRLQLEPADVALPEGAHGPRDLAVALADAELGRQLDLTHEGPDVDARVETVEGLLVDVVHGAVQPGQAGVDQLLADDGVVSAGDEDFWSQGA